MTTEDSDGGASDEDASVEDLVEQSRTDYKSARDAGPR